jgi:hypothetical protein
MYPHINMKIKIFFSGNIYIYIYILGTQISLSSPEFFKLSISPIFFYFFNYKFILADIFL